MVQIIYVNADNPLPKVTNTPLVMVLGTFDGVHLGHQYLLTEAYKFALVSNWKLATMIFSPHPMQILQPDKNITLLNDESEKISLLKRQHLDYLFIVNFSKAFANIEPHQFVEKYLISLNVKKVFVGFDYTYGKNGLGNATTLKKQGEKHFQVTIVSAIENNSKKISSTRIRKLIETGDFPLVRKLLGYNYTICGEVVYGKQLGRKLGYPTANLSVIANKVVPALGVYAVKVKVGGKWYLGMCNIGYNPTVAIKRAKKAFIEVHILDFSAQIYGETICLSWFKLIRKEKKFANVSELKQQLTADSQNIRQFFADLM